MGYFPVRYDSRVVIYERKMFIRLATYWAINFLTKLAQLFGSFLKNIFVKQKLLLLSPLIGGKFWQKLGYFLLR